MGLTMKTYAIYKTDDQFKVLVWNIGPHGQIFCDEHYFMVSEDLEVLRLELDAMGLVCVGRDEKDKESLIESWI